MKLSTDLRVRIDAAALERIWQWTALARGEFSCLGLVSDDLLVHDVQLFEQVSTQASTELDQQALAKFLVAHPQPELVRCWIHSHGNLGVFWSQQDEKCIAGLGNDTFLVSIVVNKRHEMRCRVDVREPFDLTLDEVPVEVRVPAMDLQSECEASFRRLVTEAEPTVVHGPPWRSTATPQQQPTQAGTPLAAFRWPAFDDDDPFSTWGDR